MRIAFLFFVATSAIACGGTTTSIPTDGGDDGSSGDGGLPDGPIPPPPPATKLDILFMIDNSASMGDKQDLLRAAVPDMLSRLVSPNCVDAQGRVVGKSNNGQCTSGRLEFQPVHDMHIGIVTSSLGGRGSDVCDPNAKSPANQSLNAHNDDQGHLINRGGADEHPVSDASPSNFLAWFPPVDANKGQPAPPVPALSNAATLVSDFQDMVHGVHEHGCGFEAQLESWYRFLVQPDPFGSIVRVNNRAQYQGVDATILQQRHDFLRPDSAVAVVVITDENEEVVDPIMLAGEGWAFENSSFPGSPNGAAPKGTIECQSNPLDPNCTSCAFVPPNATRCPGGAYLDPADDNLNVRMFHMRQRFGLDVQYPISRYVNGLTLPNVPDRADEHLNGNSDYTGDANANCLNPLFATNLPVDPGADLCHLQRGPRVASQVFYAIIGGVPHEFVQTATLGQDDWLKILGADPLAYDFTGADPHMRESLTPRPGLPPPTSPDTADPISGREWNTNKGDLQFACVFPLPAPKDCTQATFLGACDCEPSSPSNKAPLCDPNTPTTQIRGKAYPSIRELAVARQLGARAIVSSICPVHVTEQGAGDPLFGYRPAMTALIDRLATALAK
jgi:hypothetical protein